MRTSLTAYSPWCYDPRIVEKKDEILALIQETWAAAAERIGEKSLNYSLDFAVATDLSQCWIVEVNNFLPPLAGCGLFIYGDASDRAVMERGPFEFRIKEVPLRAEDFVQTTHDPKTGRSRTIVMQPAPQHLMNYMQACRGVSPPPPTPTPATAGIRGGLGCCVS